MTPESRCVLCDQPCSDHYPLKAAVRFYLGLPSTDQLPLFRYWWAAWWRHHTIPIAGFVLGSLPLGNELDW